MEIFAQVAAMKDFCCSALRKSILDYWIIASSLQTLQKNELDPLEIEAVSGKPRRKSSRSSSISIAIVPFKSLQLPRLVSFNADIDVNDSAKPWTHTQKQHEACSYRSSFEFWVVNEK